MQKSDRQLQRQQFEYGGYPFRPSFPLFYSLLPTLHFLLPPSFFASLSLSILFFPFPFLPFPTLFSTRPFPEVQLRCLENAEISPVGPGGTRSPNALDRSVALKSDMAAEFRTCGVYMTSYENGTIILLLESKILL